MRAWLYLIAAAVAGGIVLTPAIIVFLFGGGRVEDALLAAFATLMLGAAIAVVTMRDIIRCGLAMIVCFLALAGIYVQLGATLVAAAQVIVYIGAISVLVLFAIMLTQSKVGPAKLVFHAQARPAGLAAIALAILVAVGVYATDWPDVQVHMAVATDALARLLFDEYVLPFEVVSVLLLAAVIGGVFLAKREDPNEDVLG